MASGFASVSQEDWGGGIYRGRRAPAGSVYDCTNGLVDDEGHIFKRGGSAYWSTSDAGTTIARVATAFFPGPEAQRVLGWGNRLYVFDGTPAPVELLNWGSVLGRPAMVAGVLIFPHQGSTGNLIYYAGSLKTSTYSTGTVTVTQNSTAVTGAGTSWSANVDSGEILISGGGFGIVKSVDSNTALTLLDPWSATTAAGAAYVLAPKLNVNDLTSSFGGASYVAAAGSPARLVMTSGNRVFLSANGDPFTIPSTDYHELPSGMEIKGAEGVGDTALIFGRYCCFRG